MTNRNSSMNIAFGLLTASLAFAVIGCRGNDNESSSQTVTSDRDEAATKENAAMIQRVGQTTERYWKDCIAINNEFIARKSDIWFKQFRPGAIESACKDAAQRLRDLDTRDVERDVVDHVNRVIRGYETIGAIARVKGRESLLRDGGDILKFIYSVSKNANPGAVADGGWMEMGVGLFSGGRQATSEGQQQTSGLASELMTSEEAVIRVIRQKYEIELQPW